MARLLYIFFSSFFLWMTVNPLVCLYTVCVSLFEMKASFAVCVPIETNIHVTVCCQKITFTCRAFEKTSTKCVLNLFIQYFISSVRVGSSNQNKAFKQWNNKFRLVQFVLLYYRFSSFILLKRLFGKESSSTYDWGASGVW